MLKEGDIVPDWSMKASGGTGFSSDQLKGRHYILYFYPKDDTPGCTKEACAFRDLQSDFKSLGIPVFGVSVDSVKKHDKFVEKFELNFPLLSDEDQKVVQAFGVWGEKKFMGKTYMGTHRVTFWVGPDGVIRKVWDKVKPEAHAREVLDALSGDSPNRS